MRVGGNVATSSIVISVCGLVGQAAAFATTFLLAKLFGAKSDMDAFSATIAIPYFVTALVQGSVNKAFVPVFVREIQDGREREAWRSAIGTAGAIATALLVLTALGFLFMNTLTEVLFPSFRGVTLETAVRLASVTVPGCLPLGLATFLASIHMARRRFLFASLSQALQPVCGLVALLALPGMGILALPVGIVAGGVIQVAILAAPLAARAARHGLPGWGEAALKRIGYLVLPLLPAAGFAKAFPLLEKTFGTLLPEGAISHMAYGWKLVAFLFFLVTNGVLLSSLTFLSETAATGDRDALRRRAAAIMRGMLLTLLPLITAAFVLRVEAMSLFERGEFTRADSEASALALALYLPLLVVFSLQGVTMHVFYTLGRVRTVVIVSAASLAVYVNLGPLLAIAAGTAGLLAAYGISVSLGYVAFLVLMRPLVGGFEGAKLLVTLARGLVAAAIAGVALEVGRRALSGPLFGLSLLPRAALIGVLGTLSCIPFLGVLWLIGDRELSSLLASLRRRRKGTS